MNTFLLIFLTLSFQAKGLSEIKCTENESFDRKMEREYSGSTQTPELVTNPETGNIGDYLITYDEITKTIQSIHAVRKASNTNVIFDQKNSIISNKLTPLENGSFDGDCDPDKCRKNFEVIAAEKNEGEAITVKIDDHGVYPDGAASNVIISTRMSIFDSSEGYDTEVSCDGTVLLIRPDIDSSLAEDLLE